MWESYSTRAKLAFVDLEVEGLNHLVLHATFFQQRQLLMYEADCCECVRESCSTSTKLAHGDLEIEGQKVPGLHIFFFLVG